MGGHKALSTSLEGEQFNLRPSTHDFSAFLLTALPPTNELTRKEHFRARHYIRSIDETPLTSSFDALYDLLYFCSTTMDLVKKNTLLAL